MKASNHKQGVEDLQACLDKLINDVSDEMSRYISTLNTNEDKTVLIHHSAIECSQMLSVLCSMKLTADSLNEFMED